MGNKTKIYLAGPISGLSYGGAVDWRDFVSAALRDRMNIVPLSPMRHKEYLEHELSVRDSYEEHILSSQRGIFTRDFWDTTRCDAVFVNLLGAQRVSIGTVMEISWAHQKQTPIILVMEKSGNIHDHSMLREACPLHVDTIDAGLDVVASLFAETIDAGLDVVASSFAETE